MNMKDDILLLGTQNKGIITTKMITEHGLSRKALSELEKEEKITRVERGIYVMDSGYVDDYFLLQYRFPQGVFSHETALFLLGFSDRVPFEIQMTFPFGFNSSRAKEAGIQPIITSKAIDVGVINQERSGGTMIQVYEIERTLVDLLKPKYAADKEQLLPAFQRYAHSKERNISKLMDYARMFSVEKKVQTYLEVLI